MLNYKLQQDAMNNELFIAVDSSLVGKSLLSTPLLNKGTAFTREERLELGLLGKLPYQIETLEQQAVRCYGQYGKYKTFIQKQIFLRDLHDTNEVLFYKLISNHLTEMLPVIYTPTVGLAVEQFSASFRKPRGLYIAYPDRKELRRILDNRTHRDIDIIVVTDGERVLGIGDQGVGSIHIPISKIMLYTLFGGLDPYRCLPIYLDVGTNNEKLLADPLYLGWRHERLRGEAYEELITDFVEAVQSKFPKVFLHWEDFGKDNARTILEKYKNALCTFNDDIQGTAVVTLSAVLRASQISGIDFNKQTVAIFGAGSAGLGIADELLKAWIRLGLQPEEAIDKIWLIDKQGLLLQDQDLTPFQKKYAKSPEQLRAQGWKPGSELNLMSVLKQARPSILIGCSAVPNAFTQEHIQVMARNHARPIIFPLSNPLTACEALPKDILQWSEGQALVAAGSPCEGVAQCNNALAFPGLGLGVIAAQAQRVTDNMLWACVQAIVEFTQRLKTSHGAILPAIEEAAALAVEVASKVAVQAVADGVANHGHEATIDFSTWAEQIIQLQWQPVYKSIKLNSLMD